MLLKENIKGKTYKKLMEYLISKCNIVSVVSNNKGYYTEQVNQTIKVITSTEMCSKEDIINNYSDEYLEKIAERYKNNDKVFSEEYFDFEKNSLKYMMTYNEYKKNKRGNSDSYEEYCDTYVYDKRKNYIKSQVNYLVYNYNISKWLDKFKEELIEVKKITPYYIEYYYKISENLKQSILDKSSLCDWDFPLSIQDIAFYNNNNCLFCSEIHEKIYDLFCKDEEEYENFKLMGLKFFVNEYVPEDGFLKMVKKLHL